jgi:DNA-binding response OmpR family regulator
MQSPWALACLTLTLLCAPIILTAWFASLFSAGLKRPFAEGKPVQAKILVVEDDPTLSDTLTYNLRKHNYEVMVASDGWQALALARDEKPDLVILDWMLPGLDGLEVCRFIREKSAVPILMLTARTDEVDKVLGLEIGADDYITKPFSMRELLARVKAHLRRRTLEQQAGDAAAPKDEPGREPPLVFGELTIDPARRQVTLRGHPLRLKPKEFELLLFLARHRGVVLSRDLILERVWGWEFSGGSRTVDVHIRWLREKIEDDPSNPKRLVTVRGAGYCFEG